MFVIVECMIVQKLMFNGEFVVWIVSTRKGDNFDETLYKLVQFLTRTVSYCFVVITLSENPPLYRVIHFIYILVILKFGNVDE